jgi:hypothetical protein
MRGLQVAAIVATALVVWTAASALRRPAPRPELGGKWPVPTRVAHVPCTIQRGAFGGTEAAVVKIRKDRKVHYVVLDLPSQNDPSMYLPLSYYQDLWFKAKYGDVPPSALVGVYPTVEEAELKAGHLCRSN